MATKKTIFFSYSRTDSEFVLRLAKDLRTAGIELWVDQLDIKAGSKWDTSIEAALNSASVLIAVLSPASVASTNVMDEVSFGLENGKTIIPVLLGECTIPFRLMRLQRIDFSHNYKTAFDNLLATLNADSGTTVNSSGNIVPSKSIWPLSKKYMLAAAAVLLLIIFIWMKTSNAKSDSKDNNTETTTSFNSAENQHSNQIAGKTGSDDKNSIPQLGKFYMGGIVFYIDDSGKHGLIAAQQDLDETKWLNGPKMQIGSFSRGYYSGQENTKMIVDKLGEGQYAAKLCYDLVLNGYDDWYLPSEMEITALFNHKDQIGCFHGDCYWSSTEDNDIDYARIQCLNNTSTTFSSKGDIKSVRAIRKF